MAEPYKEAAEALKGKAVLAEVDATIEKDLASKYGVNGFPTLKLFAGGEELSEYKGGRDKDSLIKFIERAMLPSIDELKDAAAVKAFVAEHPGKTIYISTKLDKLTSAFKKQSMSLRDTIPDGVAFGAVPDAKALAGVKKDASVKDADSVLVIRDDATTASYVGEDAAAFDAFVKTSSIPLLGELSRGNAQIYTELGMPIALLFQDPKAKNDAAAKDMMELAKKHRGSDKIAFAWIDSVELKSFMDHLGIADKKVPIAIYEFEGDEKFVFEGDYSKKAVSAWIDDFVAGKLVTALKSEKIPETNDEPVKIVVGDSWETIVEDGARDVLIEQYAPWCGHCKSLAPVLDKVAEALKETTTLVIAKMDATVNDAPKAYKAKGFPTMHFFPAGKEGIQYDGGREAADFVSFFQKHATHKVPDVEFPKEEEKKEEEKKEEGDGKADEKEDAPDADAAAAEEEEAKEEL
jgi:protein disulfide isomerase